MRYNNFMKEFDVYSRYGQKYKVQLVDRNTIHFFAEGSNYVRTGLTSDSVVGAEEKVSFIDPEGGPFIGLFETPQFAFNNSKLPDREIIEIDFKDNYYILKLAPRKKKDTSLVKEKKDPRIKEQKLLKNRRHVR